MAPFSNAFQRLSLIGRRRDDGRKSVAASPRPDLQVARSTTNCPTADCLQLTKNVSTDRLARCGPTPAVPTVRPAVRFDPFCGPCTRTTTAGENGGASCLGDCESINTFLRPDNLLMGDANVKMDQTRPYLVGNKLMREIPLRDTTKILSDKELRCLHWVIGESVERHGQLW